MWFLPVAESTKNSDLSVSTNRNPARTWPAQCERCRITKGVDSFPTMELTVRLFHPRTDEWRQHFELLENGIAKPLTAVGRDTVSTQSV
jgi:hypothetical protein